MRILQIEEMKLVVGGGSTGNRPENTGRGARIGTEVGVALGGYAGSVAGAFAGELGKLSGGTARGMREAIWVAVLGILSRRES